MVTKISKVGLGGGCHWCTEGVFQSLIGVEKVEQGWIASKESTDSFSEGVIVYFNAEIISLNVLIEIHLYTHSSQVNHSMRYKYRSAVYTFNEIQFTKVQEILKNLQTHNGGQFVTQVLPMVSFRLNKQEQLNYFYSDPNKPFCVNYIHPKLKKIKLKYSEHLNSDKIPNNVFN